MGSRPLNRAPAVLECAFFAFSAGGASAPARGFQMPLRETAPKLSPEQYEKNFAEIAPRYDLQPGRHRIGALSLLFRRALHCRLPHAHRRSRLHQENLYRQFARLRARDSFRQYSRSQLRPRVPHRSALRRRLRDARKGRSRPSRSAACSATPWTTLSTQQSPLLSPWRAERQARRLHRRRPGFARLRRRTREVGLRRHDLRSQRESRRPEHLRHRRLQSCARQTPSAKPIS